MKGGLFQQASALKAIITNKSWPGARLLTEGLITPAEAVCDRCDTGAIETPAHRYYQCADNNNIDDPCIAKSDWLTQQAVDGWERTPCL